MNQLSLNMPQRLVYSPDGFILHAGVKQAVAECLLSLTQNKFGVVFVYGKPRSGKTHFSIYLADQLGRRGFFPRLLSGESFSIWSTEKCIEGVYSSDEVILVDDAQQYFGELSADRSGEFVSLVEMFRVSGSKLCFLSSKNVSDFDCDQHVVSRLVSAVGYELKDPLPEEVGPLLAALAKQRGLLLSKRQIDFLVKRVARDLPALERLMQNADYLSQVLGQPIKLSLLADAL